MKNLNDLISQIEDERILRILHQIEQDGFWYEKKISIFDIHKSDELIEDWKLEIELLGDDYEESGQDHYRVKAGNLRGDIKRLQSWKETAYLFVLLNGQLMRHIDSAEKCVEFFGKEG